MSEIADLYNENYHNNFKKVVKENKELKQEIEKLETILNEIEEIINKSCKQCMSEFLNEDYCSEGDCFEILQKIKEVKEGED